MLLMVVGASLAGCEARVNRERDNYGFLELHKAAREGNLALAQKLIQEGAKVNLTDMDGMTPLHSAAKNTPWTRHSPAEEPRRRHHPD
jgi:ankyrin repeat protein